MNYLSQKDYDDRYKSALAHEEMMWDLQEQIKRRLDVDSLSVQIDLWGDDWTLDGLEEVLAKGNVRIYGDLPIDGVLQEDYTLAYLDNPTFLNIIVEADRAVQGSPIGPICLRGVDVYQDGIEAIFSDIGD